MVLRLLLANRCSITSLARFWGARAATDILAIFLPAGGISIGLGDSIGLSDCRGSNTFWLSAIPRGILFIFACEAWRVHPGLAPFEL
jgi:hypothetical protein